MCGSSGLCAGDDTCCGTGATAAARPLTDDNKNCGACGTACDPARADSCSGGSCQCGTGAQCATGQTCCTGAAAQPDPDMNNCGTCGNRCYATRSDSCSGGACQCGTGGPVRGRTRPAAAVTVPTLPTTPIIAWDAASNICDRNKADSCNNGCRCGSGAACGTNRRAAEAPASTPPPTPATAEDAEKFGRTE